MNAFTRGKKGWKSIYGVSDYTLKDSRHSIGVRMRLRGESFEAISEQLGTSLYQTVQVYAAYKQEEASETKETGS